MAQLACAAELRRFLHERFYGHHRVVRMSEQARRVLDALFATYLAEPRQLPPEHLSRFDAEGLHTVVCDDLASLTDRPALEMYHGL